MPKPAKRDVKVEEEKFVWTNEKTRTLIEAYKEHPYLWDNKNPKYLDDQLKKNKYAEIAIELGEPYTAEIVKQKIRNLRTYYKYECKKSKKVTGSGVDAVYVSKWPFFEALHFLKDSITPGDSIDNLNETKESDRITEDLIEDDDQSDISMTAQDNAGSVKQASNSCKPQSSPVDLIRKRKVTKPSPVKLLKEEVLKKAAVALGQDSIDTQLSEYHFAISVAKSLDEMSAYGRDYAKAEIQKILFQAKYLNTPSAEPSASGFNQYQAHAGPASYGPYHTSGNYAAQSFSTGSSQMLTALQPMTPMAADSQYPLSMSAPPYNTLNVTRHSSQN